MAAGSESIKLLTDAQERVQLADKKHLRNAELDVRCAKMFESNKLFKAWAKRYPAEAERVKELVNTSIRISGQLSKRRDECKPMMTAIIAAQLKINEASEQLDAARKDVMRAQIAENIGRRMTEEQEETIMDNYEIALNNYNAAMKEIDDAKTELEEEMRPKFTI